VFLENVFADYLQAASGVGQLAWGRVNIPFTVALVPSSARMLSALLLLLAVLPGCDQLSRFRGAQTAFSGDSALAFAKAQVAFGPRVPGTDAHRKAGDWIIAQMKSRADSVEVQSWTHRTLTGVSLPMRNIVARFNVGATNRVLYVTHWDSRPTADSDRNLGARQRPFDSANDGAAGVGMFVALAAALKKTPPNVGVDLVFVDGEDWGTFESWEDTTKNKDVLIGSQYFARTMPATYKPLFGVVFDMIGDASLQLSQEAYSANSAPEVVTKVWDMARELGYSKYFLREPGTAITDDHLPFIRKGLHVIDVIDVDYCSDGGRNCEGEDRNLHHTAGDTIDKVSAKSLQIVGDVALALVTR
jgi:glutaminyl-peptide cyclotransferase